MGPYVLCNQLRHGGHSHACHLALLFLGPRLLTLRSRSPEAGPGLLVQLTGYAVQGFSMSLFSQGDSSSPVKISHQSPIFKSFQLALEAFGMK